MPLTPVALKSAMGLEKPKGFTARVGVEVVLCKLLRNIDDVNGPSP